jgi:hypothetical protein
MMGVVGGTNNFWPVDRRGFGDGRGFLVVAVAAR